MWGSYYSPLFLDMMGMSIFMWNIRGAVNVRGRRWMKEIVKKHKLDVIILVETHSIFSRVEKFWTSLDYYAVDVEEQLAM